MYNREEELLEQYGLEIRNTAKGRGALICDTNQGTFLFKVFRGSKERADFLYEILDFLCKQGFLADSLHPYSEDEVLLKDDVEETLYCMKSYFPGKECDVKNRDDILTAVKKLAGLHNLAKCYDKEIPEFLKTKKDSLLDEYQRHNRELNKVKNYIRHKHRKNDFEILFMQVYANYQEQAKEVTQQLQKQMENLSAETEGQIWGLCHGDFNQHNIVYYQDDWAVVNFEQMSYDVQIQDLANFMRKILEKHNWNTGLGIEMITVYDKIRKLLPEELEQLYLRLAYPHKYWKIANHYYNSRKSWISGRDIEKLQKIMGQEEQRKQFLRMLFHFTSQN